MENNKKEKRKSTIESLKILGIVMLVLYIAEVLRIYNFEGKLIFNLFKYEDFFNHALIALIVVVLMFVANKIFNSNSE